MNQVSRIGSWGTAILATNLIRLASVLISGIAGVSGATSVALATPISYTETVTGTGSLNGTAFTEATVTLTMTADTTGVVSVPPDMFVNNGTTTISVAGFAPVTLRNFTGGLSPPTFDDSIEISSGPGGVGFIVSVPPVGPISPPTAGILDDASASFAGYDLQTSIGPISGTAAISPGFLFVTTGGGFILNSIEGPTGIFTASTAVPEPSTLALLGVGLLGLGWMRRRVRTTAA